MQRGLLLINKGLFFLKEQFDVILFHAVSAAAEGPPQQQDQCVAADRCLPLTNTDVSHRTLTPGDEGAREQRRREKRHAGRKDADENEQLSVLNHFPCGRII